MLYWLGTPAEFIVALKLYFIFKISQSICISAWLNEFVAIFKPEETILPSSIIQTASANGERNSSTIGGTVFTPFT